MSALIYARYVGELERGFREAKRKVVDPLALSWVADLQEAVLELLGREGEAASEMCGLTEAMPDDIRARAN